MLTAIKAVAVRAMQIGIVALLVTAGTNIMIRLVPGDPARNILGTRASDEALTALRHELGIDTPLVQQVGVSLARLVQGDLGTSFAYQGQSVTTVIGSSLIVTGSLAALAIVLALIVGVPLGLSLALVRRSGADLLGRLALTLMLALPSFVAGLLALYMICLQLRLAPAGGWAGAWPANFEYLWLPAAALSVYLGALIARAVRQEALVAIAQPFVEAARTRGVPRFRIIVHHVLPNALLPVITLVGFNAGILVSGAVTIEAVFALPGLGSQLLQAMGSRDLPVVQGIALLTAVSVVLFNMLADLAIIAIDPRLRRNS